MFLQMKKELTILIPTFNRANLLNRAIESLSQQNQDIKIHCIISDNASKDSTTEVVSKWKNHSKNLIISYKKHFQEIEPFLNWKSMIDYIDTDYSKFLFDDDWLENDALSTMLSDINILNADSIIYNTNIYAKTKKFVPIYNYYDQQDLKLTTQNVIDSVLRNSKPFPVTPSAAIQSSTLLKKAMQFSEVNTECTKKIIGNDLIMNFYPVFVGKHSHYKNESIVNLWGGEDSITINTTNGRLLSFCYLKSLIYLIEKNEISLDKNQARKINNKIFINNFRSIYDKETTKFSNSDIFHSKISLKEIFAKFSKKK